MIPQNYNPSQLIDKINPPIVYIKGYFNNYANEEE